MTPGWITRLENASPMMPCAIWLMPPAASISPWVRRSSQPIATRSALAGARPELRAQRRAQRLVLGVREPVAEGEVARRRRCRCAWGRARRPRGAGTATGPRWPARSWSWPTSAGSSRRARCPAFAIAIASKPPSSGRVEHEDGAPSRRHHRRRQQAHQDRVLVVLARGDDPQVEALAPHHLGQHGAQALGEPAVRDLRLAAQRQDLGRPVAGVRRGRRRGGRWGWSWRAPTSGPPACGGREPAPGRRSYHIARVPWGA